MENEIVVISFGAEHSPKDYRNIQSQELASGTILANSNKVNLDYDFVNRLCNQLKLGICTKCAGRMAQESFNSKGKQLSEYWGYLIQKILIDDVIYGFHFEGSSASTMLKASWKYGTPSKDIEQSFPLKTDGTYQEFIQSFKDLYGGVIPQAVLLNAANNKIPGYYHVPVDPVSLAKEISNGKVLIARVEVGDNWWTKPDGSYSNKAKDLMPIRTPKTVVSGHLVCLNEYNGLNAEQLLIGPNSWSENWGNKGYFSFIFNQQAPYYFTEAWAIGEIPPEVIQLVKDLPEAKNFKYNFPNKIERGNTGDDVKKLQIALSILGFLDIKVEELGSYGPKTAKAVLAYQIARKLLPVEQLQANGGNYVHALTLSALRKDFSN